ncbi:hypothetical protein FKM82_007126 [Ascaphus truei]
MFSNVNMFPVTRHTRKRKAGVESFEVKETKRITNDVSGLAHVKKELRSPRFRAIFSMRCYFLRHLPTQGDNQPRSFPFMDCVVSSGTGRCLIY